MAADAIFLSIFLAPVLLKFHKEYPNISLQIESFNSDESFGLLEKHIKSTSS